jgi:hypothetical protein
VTESFCKKVKKNSLPKGGKKKKRGSVCTRKQNRMNEKLLQFLQGEKENATETGNECLVEALEIV